MKSKEKQKAGRGETNVAKLGPNLLLSNQGRTKKRGRTYNMRNSYLQYGAGFNLHIWGQHVILLKLNLDHFMYKHYIAPENFSI